MIDALHPLIPIYLKFKQFTKSPSIKRNAQQNNTQLFTLHINQTLLEETI